VAPLFDERNPAVLEMLRRAIEAGHRAGRKVSICGQAPSDFPEIASFLVACGIDSLSLGPDAAVAVRLRVAADEARLAATASAGVQVSAAR
jgi:pyruvate,water dikinase